MIGRRIVDVLGRGGAEELLDVLQRPSQDRAAAIGTLYAREHMLTLAEALIEVESDPDDLTRLG